MSIKDDLNFGRRKPDETVEKIVHDGKKLSVSRIYTEFGSAANVDHRSRELTREEKEAWEGAKEEDV